MKVNNTFSSFRWILTHKFALLATIALLSQGCVTQTPPAPVETAGKSVQTGHSSASLQGGPPGVPPDPSTYIARLKLLPAAQLLAEVSTNRRQFQDVPSAENRIRLALALWASAGDDQEIQRLAEGSLNGESEQIRGISALIAAIAVERRRNSEMATKSQSRSRESRKELDSQHAKVDALQRQIIELEGKLAALREMEKSLIQRQGTIR